LRVEAFKRFIMITDDRPDCTFTDAGGQSLGFDDAALTPAQTAADFDAALLALSPEQFGTTAERRYDWHSVVGLAPTEDGQPWQPDAPLVADACPQADAPGLGYQALSTLTGGLRFPSCQPQDLIVIFEHVAEGIVRTVSCE
jgi:hypothetical protein